MRSTTRRAFVLFIAIAVALGVYFTERHWREAERDRLAEATAALRQESARARELADQVAALREQMSTLGDRVSGLERDNRDLRRRLGNSRRPHTDVAAFAPTVEAIGPAAEAEEVPSIEERLIGEPSPLDTVTLRLTPSSTWPVVERQPLGAPSRFADPAFMKRMYLSYGVLQVVDISSTIVALQRGGQEANPLLSGFAGNPAALIGVKAATTVGTVFLIEKLRKTKPVTAAIMLAAINSTLAVVAVNNVKAARAQTPQ